jgi:hypothetical protein
MDASSVANELSSSAGTDMDRLDIECLDIVIAPLVVVLCDDWLEAFFRRDFLCATSFVALRCSCFHIGQYLYLNRVRIRFGLTRFVQVQRFRQWNRDRIAGVEPAEWANFQDAASDSDYD